MFWVLLVLFFIAMIQTTMLRSGLWDQSMTNSFQLCVCIFFLPICVCFYSIGCVLGKTGMLKNKAVINQMLSWPYCMVGYNLTVLLCAHNSISFEKMPNTTGWNAAPNCGKASNLRSTEGLDVSRRSGVGFLLLISVLFWSRLLHLLSATCIVSKASVRTERCWFFS